MVTGPVNGRDSSFNDDLIAIHFNFLLILNVIVGYLKVNKSWLSTDPQQQYMYMNVQVAELAHF